MQRSKQSRCSKETRQDTGQVAHGKGKKRDGKRIAVSKPYCSQMCFYYFIGLRFLLVPFELPSPLVQTTLSELLSLACRDPYKTVNT